jgi:hypothetical protein
MRRRAFAGHNSAVSDQLSAVSKSGRLVFSDWFLVFSQEPKTKN